MNKQASQNSRVIKPSKTFRILPPKGFHALDPNPEFEADRQSLNSVSTDQIR
jgi:hypothetical protein